jgi:ketosteroid isomerase-like protein
MGSNDTAERNIEIIKHFFRSIEAGDWQEAERNFDFDNFELHESPGLPYGGVWHGKAAFNRFHEIIYDTWKPLEHQILEFLGGGEWVCAYQMLVGTGKTGLSFSTTVAEMWRIRNGKIIEIRPHYWDTHRMRAIDGRLP